MIHIARRIITVLIMMLLLILFVEVGMSQEITETSHELPTLQIAILFGVVVFLAFVLVLLKYILKKKPSGEPEEPESEYEGEEELVNEVLVAFIDEKLAKGVDKMTLKEKLYERKHWSPEEVDKAFEFVDKQSTGAKKK